jgi:hypothetical protein
MAARSKLASYLAGASAGGVAGLAVVFFEELELFLVVVVLPFFVDDLVDVAALVSLVAGAVAGAWAKAAKDVARTSALMRFFMGFETPGSVG